MSARHSMKSAVLLLAAVLLALPLPARSATYDEMINGNLSSNHSAPTPFAVTPGVNTIRGGIASSWDFVTFTIPAGYFMTSLRLDSFANGGGSGISFFAIAPGTSSPIVPVGNDAVGLLGWILFNANTTGRDLLLDIGLTGSGAPGFRPPLPAGSYTFWVQDYSETISYQFSFNLELRSVPVIKLSGKKDVTVSKTSVKLAGKVSGNVSEVSYRVGRKGAFKLAKGTSAWSLVAKQLKPGKNLVTVKATGVFGTTSTKVMVTVRK